MLAAKGGKNVSTRDLPMSFSDWISKLFESKDDDDSDDLEDGGFEVSQHTRIVIALLVVLISACIMWWILE